MSLSLDDGTWLHLKAASVLDFVGQNPRVIYDVRWRGSVCPEPYLMKPGAQLQSSAGQHNENRLRYEPTAAAVMISMILHEIEIVF